MSGFVFISLVFLQATSLSFLGRIGFQPVHWEMTGNPAFCAGRRHQIVFFSRLFLRTLMILKVSIRLRMYYWSGHLFPFSTVRAGRPSQR